MKLSEEVTREMLADIVEQTLEDMEKYRLDAKEAYEANKNDDFHMYMDTMFGLAIEMFRSRLSTICDDDLDEEVVTDD